tara:strand:+ start:565 stop:765 length:201 start_codon:yes stop_codon:yes gene_type:complete
MVNWTDTPTLILAGITVAIVQLGGFVIAVDYFGYFGAVAIPWSILILYFIWCRVSGKGIFASDEEE